MVVMEANPTGSLDNLFPTTFSMESLLSRDIEDGNSTKLLLRTVTIVSEVQLPIYINNTK